MELTLVAVIVVALFFDFTNGFHDAANAIATTVATRALAPRVAVVFAAVLNVVGAFVSVEVAATIAKGIVDADVITLEIVLGGVVGATAWNLTTWYLGLPTSSSHALIGGVLGSAISAEGFDVVLVEGLVEKVFLPSLASPLLGIVLAGTLVVAILWLFRNARPGRVGKLFRRLQVVSAGFVAFTHGTNDAQKTMGVITLALVASGDIASDDFHVPWWVVLSAGLAMGAGTYAGGWRIMRTLGQRVVHLDPHQGFAAETATAAILYTTAHAGFPVSTTHTISGSVLGAGAAHSISAVRWGIARSILLAWVLTIPAAGLVGATMERLTRLPGGVAIVFGVTVALALAALSARGWDRHRIRFRPSEEGAAGAVAPPD